ncbi:hypothetical protein GKR48_10820 [Providencia sp. wls1943]|uniref:Glycosyl transferase GT11 family protein n=1 Tax=Providencia alcalifaciens TaxID=126385 RepID=A0A346CLK7_9GAMM|nr:glycosyl transferase GT11 family protein [Providencia alcalifaciens]MTB67311.1 hypothetical protein [Providencia sp. wls1943]
MKRKTIFLSGGLGNNLFQIAYGEFLEQSGYEVIFQTVLTKKNMLTKLLGWSIHSNDITEKLLLDKKTLHKANIIDILFLSYHFLKKKITKDKFYKTTPSNNSRYFGYAVEGEHLNEKVFSIISNKIKKYFPHKISNKKTNTILHIRKGDFSNNCTLTDDYYIKAISDLSVQDTIIIVTDEPKILDHVKKKIHSNVELSNGKSMLDDFFTIFNSKNAIMSNSTYCYWACILGNVDNVFFPSRISTTQDWFFHLNAKNSKKIECQFISELESSQ